MYIDKDTLFASLDEGLKIAQRSNLTLTSKELCLEGYVSMTIAKGRACFKKMPLPDREVISGWVAGFLADPSSVDAQLQGYGNEPLVIEETDKSYDIVSDDLLVASLSRPDGDNAPRLEVCIAEEIRLVGNSESLSALSIYGSYGLSCTYATAEVLEAVVAAFNVGEWSTVDDVPDTNSIDLYCELAVKVDEAKISEQEATSRLKAEFLEGPFGHLFTPVFDVLTRRGLTPLASKAGDVLAFTYSVWFEPKAILSFSLTPSPAMGLPGLDWKSNPEKARAVLERFDDRHVEMADPSAPGWKKMGLVALHSNTLSDILWICERVTTTDSIQLGEATGFSTQNP